MVTSPNYFTATPPIAETKTAMNSAN
jgi:hypothetical protein